MADDLETALLGTIGNQLVPRAYIDFQLCREMGWTPQQLADLPQHQYREWLSFMQAESNARTHNARRAEFQAGG